MLSVLPKVVPAAGTFIAVVPPMRPTYGILSLASAIARILRYVALSSGLPTSAIVRSFSLRHQARAASPSISSSHRCGSAFTSRCAADTGRLDGSSEAPEKPARLHAARRRRGRSAENIDATFTHESKQSFVRPRPSRSSSTRRACAHAPLNRGEAVALFMSRQGKPCFVLTCRPV